MSEPKPPVATPRTPSGLSMLVLHLHPKMVPEEALAFPRTFGLGGMAVVLFVLLAATGALLLLVYEPSTERAYVSVQALVDEVPFGRFIRNIHHWSAAAFLLIASLHLLRVFYTGAHRAPRRANWFVGLALLLLIVASNFTGYLLPWDQLSYWAVTISTGMLEYVPLAGATIMRAVRGGADIGPRTLGLFFVLHVAILPLTLLVLTSMHFWFVRKAGGVMLPSSAGTRRTMVPAVPNLVVREGVVALAIVAAILLVAAIADAPLLAPANPGMSPNPAKAPWYFMGLQELLVHLHPTVAVVVVPLLAAVFLLMLPSLAASDAATGRYFQSRAGAGAALAAAAAALIVVPAWILASDRLRRGLDSMAGVPPAVRTGILPLALFAIVLAIVYGLASRRPGATRLEAIQAVFTFLVVGFVILTITGALFRGQGMALVWPW